MDKDLILSLGSKELMTTSAPALLRILDAIPISIQVLEAVYQDKKIVDFKFLVVNAAAKKYVPCESIETFLAANSNTYLFDNMVKVVETGSEYQSTQLLNSDGRKTLLKVKCIKFNNGVLLSCEESENENSNGKTDTHESVQDVAELYRSVVENSPDAISRWNKELRLIYANGAVEAKTGVPNASIIGKNNIEMGQPDEVARNWMGKLQEVFDTGKPVADYNFFPTPRGKIFFHTRLVPEKNPDGSVATVLAIARDVTELRKTEEELERIIELQQRAYKILDTMDNGCYELDLNGCFIFANRKAKELYKTTDEQLIGNNIWELFPEAKKSFCHTAIQEEALDQRKHAQYEYKSPVLNQWISLTATPTKEGCIVLFNEMDDVQNTRDQLEEKNSVLEAIYNASLSGILIFKSIRDEKNNIIDYEWTYATRAIQELMAKGNLVGARMLEQFPTVLKNGLFEKYKAVIETGESIKFEQHYEGEGFDDWFSITVAKHDDGCVLGIENIAVRKKNEQKLQESAELLTIKNKDLETLISELKTFNTVAGRDYKETIKILYTNLEYIASTESRKLSDTSRANIRKAQVAIQKMKLLTDDINSYLHFYNIEAKKELIDPNNILQKLLSDMREKIDKTGVKIESAELPSFPADPNLFSRLLANLIDNAIKFRKPSGHPHIKINYSKVDELNELPQAKKNTPYTIISVSDNGIGFTDKEAERIFELFFSLHDKSKYKGSGIGLAICKKIMIMQEGFITAKGIAGGGATFYCYFPVTK